MRETYALHGALFVILPLPLILAASSALATFSAASAFSAATLAASASSVAALAALAFSSATLPGSSLVIFFAASAYLLQPLLFQLQLPSLLLFPLPFWLHPPS